MWYVYSPESFPNPELIGKAGYTPEFLMHAGVQLPPLTAKEWATIPDNFYNTKHTSWRDKTGTREHVATADIVGALKNRFQERGVIFLDHAPSVQEKVVLEALAQELNMKFRARSIDTYENAVREKEVTGIGRTRPTPYEDECYSLLKLPKPYSVEAFRAQRQPGQEAAERIADAIAGALKANQPAPARPVKTLADLEKG